MRSRQGTVVRHREDGSLCLSKADTPTTRSKSTLPSLTNKLASKPSPHLTDKLATRLDAKLVSRLASKPPAKVSKKPKVSE